VIALRPAEIEELFEVRALLEARAAARAAPRLTDEALARLRALCAPRLCALIAGQRNVMQPYLQALNTLVGRRATAQREHREILDAAKRRDGARLAELTVAHLRTSAQGMIRYLVERAAGVGGGG
jgi:DNA-binding GntR family transcriptional regulator